MHTIFALFINLLILLFVIDLWKLNTKEIGQGWPQHPDRKNKLSCDRQSIKNTARYWLIIWSASPNAFWTIYLILWIFKVPNYVVQICFSDCSLCWVCGSVGRVVGSDTGSAGFDLGLSELKPSTLTTWPPQRTLSTRLLESIFIENIYLLLTFD